MFRLFTIKFHFYFFVSFGFFFVFFCFFSLFSLFFALNFSLRFDFVIFASKRNEGENFFASKEAKFNILRIISLPNFVSGEKKTFLLIFLLNFRFASIFSLSFRFFYLRFRFRFLVFCIEVNHVKSGFFCFKAKQNFRFNFKFRFQSENEGAP